MPDQYRWFMPASTSDDDDDIEHPRQLKFERINNATKSIVSSTLIVSNLVGREKRILHICQ